MCVSSPGRVLAVDPTGATIDLDGRVRRASTLLLPEVAVGDHVLVAAGTVIRRLDADELAELAELLAIARDDTLTTPERSLT
jgi:hydrogenase assembly chaperone HypC/HupF